MRRVAAAFAALAACGLIGACNAKDEPASGSQTQVATDVNAVAITSFSLQADKDVMSGLDSVFFSIDTKNGIIFNADSLPKGTDVKKLKTKIQFYNAVSVAEYTMENGTHRTGTSDYRTQPNDTIDFTGDVSLKVVSGDSKTQLTYRIKVNVHKMDPDSLAWAEMAVAKLPSRLASPRRQTTVQFASGAACLIEESDGSWTMAKATEESPEWSKQPVAFAFTPDVRSFAASDDALYVLDDQGTLHSSPDGVQWTSTGKKWVAVTGGYAGYVLGIVSDGNGMRHTSYPADGALPESALEPGFPVSGSTTVITVENRWAEWPAGILSGGRDAEGNVSGATWAFDGSVWARISETAVPAVEGAVMVPYFAFRKTSGRWKLNEFSVLMLFGGRLADGSMNRKTYISYDNGVNWREGSQQLVLPDFIPAVWLADAVIMEKEMSGSLSGWAKMPALRLPAGARVKYETEGDEIRWDCPYIYLFGGFGSEGGLNDSVWRGALNRLTFKPII